MSEKKQRELRVRCLVLDHDDTVVKSTPEINFPAFLRSLKDLRGTTMSYEQFVEYNFDPGFYEMCADILHYTPEEIRYQEAEWERAAAVTIPAVYEGLPVLRKSERAALDHCRNNDYLSVNLILKIIIKNGKRLRTRSLMRIH